MLLTRRRPATARGGADVKQYVTKATHLHLRLCSPRVPVYLLLLTYRTMQARLLQAAVAVTARKRSRRPSSPRSDRSTSNDHLDAPEEAVPVNTKLPQGLFDEFTAL